MERQGQPRARGVRRGGGGGGCEAGGVPEGGEAVVQRTQVVLLAGEPWGLDGGQTVLSSFAHHVVPSTATAATSGGPARPPSGSFPAAAAPLPSSPSGRLIFFLCRASSLREREARLRELLRGLGREPSGGPSSSDAAPAVLVGVVVQPPPGEEQEALGRLEDLLRDAFRPDPDEDGQPPPAAPLELHTALFAPGRPEGALELRRLLGPPNTRLARRRQQSGASLLCLDKSLAMQVLGVLVTLGTMAYGGYYAYNSLLLLLE